MIPGIYGVFPTADGWIAIVGTAGPARDLFYRTIGRPDLIERFTTLLYFEDDKAALWPILDEVFATKPTAEWCDLLGAAGLRFAPVHDHAEVAADPGVRANGYIASVEDPDAPGTITEVVRAPVRFSDPLPAVRPRVPELGEHTEEVLLEAGYSWDDIAAFRRRARSKAWLRLLGLRHVSPRLLGPAAAIGAEVDGVRKGVESLEEKHDDAEVVVAEHGLGDLLGMPTRAVELPSPPVRLAGFIRRRSSWTSRSPDISINATAHRRGTARVTVDRIGRVVLSAQSCIGVSVPQRSLLRQFDPLGRLRRDPFGLVPSSSSVSAMIGRRERL